VTDEGYANDMQDAAANSRLELCGTANDAEISREQRLLRFTQLT
jgi:hypothetical protein